MPLVLIKKCLGLGFFFCFLSVGEKFNHLHYKESSPCEGADGKCGCPDGEQGFCRAGWTFPLLSHGDLSPFPKEGRGGSRSSSCVRNLEVGVSSGRTLGAGLALND